MSLEWWFAGQPGASGAAASAQSRRDSQVLVRLLLHTAGWAPFSDSLKNTKTYQKEEEEEEEEEETMIQSPFGFFVDKNGTQGGGCTPLFTEERLRPQLNVQRLIYSKGALQVLQAPQGRSSLRPRSRQRHRGIKSCH